MNLLEHIRALNQAAVTPMVFGMGIDNSPIDRDLAAGLSVATINETLAAASDAEVAQAYAQVGDGAHDWAAELLLAEAQRRNLAL